MLESQKILASPAKILEPVIWASQVEYFIVMIARKLSKVNFNAGVVFTACTEPYLSSEYGSSYMSDSPVKLLEKLLYGKRSDPGEETVILSQVLACEATLGYEDFFNVQVCFFPFIFPAFLFLISSNLWRAFPQVTSHASNLPTYDTAQKLGIPIQKRPQSSTVLGGSSQFNFALLRPA